MRKRSIPIQVYLNEEEYAKLKQLSRNSGFSMTKVIRRMIVGEELRDLPDVDFRELARAVDRIGNNYNQLAYRANRTGMVGNDDWLQSHLLLTQIRQEIETWKRQWQ